MNLGLYSSPFFFFFGGGVALVRSDVIQIIKIKIKIIVTSEKKRLYMKDEEQQHTHTHEIAHTHNTLSSKKKKKDTKREVERDKRQNQLQDRRSTAALIIHFGFVLRGRDVNQSKSKGFQCSIESEVKSRSLDPLEVGYSKVRGGEKARTGESDRCSRTSESP